MHVRKQKMTYFHIQRINGIRKEWDINDTATTERNQFNDFFQDILSGIERQANGNKLIPNSEKIIYDTTINELDQASENYEKLFNKTLNQYLSLRTTASQLFESHLQYLKYIREEIFENTRKQINSELPSRKKCLWICKKDELEYWWNEISNTKPKKIIEIELEKEGKIHIADGELIKSENYSINEFNEMSNKYWKGEINNKSVIEILFEGKFKVINKYNNLEELNTYT